MNGDIPEVRDLGTLLREQEQRRGDAPALIGTGRPPGTYGALAAQSRVLGRFLRARGLTAADRLAVVLPDGPEMAGAFLTLAPNVAVAPLNPSYRAEELEFYLADLGAKGVVLPRGSDGPARSVARARGLAIFELESRPDAGAGLFELHDAAGGAGSAGMGAGDDGAASGSGENAVALLLHTSGTTSRPKLVPLSHGNLCASGRHIARTARLGPEDRCLSVMPLFHIHGLVGVLLSSMTAGGTVVCTPGFDGARFFDWIREFRPTWYSAVPTMHQAIVERGGRLSETGGVPKGGLRFIRSSSAALSPVVMERLEAMFGVPVIESYGMTEAAHQMASNPLPPGVRKPGSVGPAAGPDIAIFDEQGRPVPAGERGEVCIRGPNVTRGYERSPEANAAAYTGDGWFRTGDQGFLDPDGYLVLSGRLKEIVNRGGEKIGPREIDDVLLAHPAVRQAVAFAVPHPTLGEDLAAAAVVVGASPPSESELRAHLLERLPAFKVPSRILLVDEIPKGPTGKIQRIGLHQRLAGRFESPYEAPRPGWETELTGIFGEVLGRDRIGRLDHFFTLGGDSIRATQVAARVSRRHPLLGEVSPVLLFRHPTLAAFAAELERGGGNASRGGSEDDELAEQLARLSPEERDRLMAELDATDEPKPRGS